MKFEWTINIGNLMTGLLLLVGFIAAHIQNIRKMQDIETKVALIYSWFKKRVIERDYSDND